MAKFKRVVILSDGIRGHYHQSLGVAKWLERISGAEVSQTIIVPKLSGVKRLLQMKILVKKIALQDEEYSRQWLMVSGLEAGIFESDTLFISTGSTAAPYCLALAKSTKNKSAVIMTPSVLGTKPFDFAIVPEHDAPDPNAKNIITTLGAPNHIFIPDLKEAAKKFFENVTGEKILAVLVGGSDANYKLSPEWARKVLAPLRKIQGIKILLTTSRRTGRETDNEIAKIFDGCDYVLLASQDPDTNPIPAMLGKATHVLVTEDSVSMASEAATAGFRVGLIRVPRVTGAIKNFLGFGAQRFDELFSRMASKNLLQDLGKAPNFEKFLQPPEQRHGQDFNEAKRAAEFILSHC